MTKPYAILINKTDGRKFCLDRSYNLIPDDEVEPPADLVRIGDIIESSDVFFPSYEYQYPEWAKQYLNFREDFITLWTNYYE